MIRTSTAGLIAAAVFAALILLVMPTHAQTGDISTVAGGGVGDGSTPTLAVLASPAGVVVDSGGNIYVADSAAHRIRKIDNERNTISTIAGNGAPGYSGDGGPAFAATIHSPFGMAIDINDNLYFADSQNHRIRKINLATGHITTVAGSGSSGFDGDGGPALYATFSSPRGVDVDRYGNIYIADTFNNRIRKVDAFNGIVTTIAGIGISGSGGDLGLAREADLYQPEDVAVDDLGRVYIADTGNHLIRMVDTEGIIDTLAGMRGAAVDPITVAAASRARSAVLRTPRSITLDNHQRNLYVADTGNNLVRRIVLNNLIDEALVLTEVGSFDGSPGYDGENKAPLLSSLDSPSGVDVNSDGEIFISDTDNNRVRALVFPGERRISILVTVAGNGERSFSGEQAPAENATLHFPSDVAIDSDGNIYFSDTANHRVRRIDRETGLIRTVAGSGAAGSLGEGGQGTDARLNSPEGLAFDSNGDLYIADTANNRVLKLDIVSGVISRIAGDGHDSFKGENINAREASLNRPKALAIDEDDNLYLADSRNNRIRVIDLDTNQISTLAGNNQTGFGGDGGAARGARLANPEGVAVDPNGNIIIADTGNRRIRRVEAGNGTISTIAGNGSVIYAGDGGPATEASMSAPRRVAAEPNGNVFISDALDHRIRAIKSDGTMTTVAGNGIITFTGDGGPALSASLNRPLGMAVDAEGNLYFADNQNDRIRVIAAPVIEEPTPTPSPTDTPTQVPTPTPTPEPTPTATPTPTPHSLPDLAHAGVQYVIGQSPVCRSSRAEPEFPPITFSVVVRNDGSASSGPFVVEINGASRAAVAELGALDSAVLQVTGITSGENTIVLDAASQVEESDESNNSTTFLVVLPTLPAIPVCTPTPTPVPPTATPTNTPTPVPTSTPTPVPTFTPTPVPPTPVPVPPTATPAPPTSTPTPTPVPTKTPTPVPTNTPTPVPPTATPTVTPIIIIVTATPTAVVAVPLEPEDAGPNIGLIIGIAFVGILTVAILVGLYIVYRRRTFGH